ncbi:MAG: carboxylating nicotinate-nucleotide diphosphorylase [Candidatus Omnitrophota bacterium]
MHLKQADFKNILKAALKEDAAFSDITTQNLIEANLKVRADIIVKQDCILAGLSLVKSTFKTIDPKINFKAYYCDADQIKKNTKVLSIFGKARAILSAERVALNYLSHLSGIATQTHEFVRRVYPNNVKILDTRKTIPGLRTLQKYAVRVGGGFNHRKSLSEAVLIKTNHLRLLLKSDNFKEKVIKEAIYSTRKNAKGKIVEIEVANLSEFNAALKARPDIIMLDNFNVDLIRMAVRIRNDLSLRKTLLEVSGGVNLENVERIAKTGIDLISVGSLTHSAKAVNLALEIVTRGIK